MKTIAVYSPLSELTKRANMDFMLRLKDTHQELTLDYLHHLATCSYNTDIAYPSSNSQQDTISAAGYYLTSLLRINDYNAILTPNIDDDSLRKIANQNPIAFCISTTMILEKQTLASIIRQIRKHMKNVVIIVGGFLVWKSYLWLEEAANLLHKNLVSQEMVEKAGTIFPCGKSDIDADIFVVSPHGGWILLNILKEIENKGNNQYNFDNIPNLAIPDSKGMFYFTRRIEEVINYDEDFTHWELIDELPARIPVRTSVGCPYRCGYCDFCHLYPKIIFRSLNSLKTELNSIKKGLNNHSGLLNRTLNFSDDNIFINSKRAREICQLLIDMEMGLNWSGFIRASSIDDSNISLIKQSGLKRAWVGVESGDQAQLNRMNKKLDIATVKKGIELLDNEGISSHMSYIIGYLGESDGSVNNTIDFLNNLNIVNSVYMVYPLIIMPLSEISSPKIRRKWDVKGIFKEWSHQTMDSQTAAEKCKYVFKNVKSVPYYYSQENNTFLQKINEETRKKIYALRQEITVAIMDKVPWQDIAHKFSKVATMMGVDATPPGIEFGKKITLFDS